MLRKLFKSLFKLSVYGVGLSAMYGAWDYTQKWEAAEGDLTVAQYVMSLNDQYGGAVSGVAFQAMSVAQAGFASGVVLVNDSGVLEKVGVEMPEHLLTPVAEPEVIVADPALQTEAEPVETAGPVLLASADRVMAPEVSLLPRSRPTQ